MTYLMFEMSLWLLAAFVAGLLLGVWVGYICCGNAEGANPLDDKDSEDSIEKLEGKINMDEVGPKADVVKKINKTASKKKRNM